MRFLLSLLLLLPWISSAQVVVPTRRLGGAPPSDLKIWVDGSQLTSAQNTILSPWADLSGNANNINQAQGNMLVKTNIQNGYRGVDFPNGVGGRSVGPTIAANGPWTVICAFVMTSPANAAGARALQMNAGNFGLGAASSGTTFRLVWVNGGTVVINTAATIGVPRVHVITAATNPVTKWIIGNYSFVNTTNAGPPGTLFSLGSDTVAEPMTGQWLEFRMYNRVLTQLEVDRSIHYMLGKWAIAP